MNQAENAARFAGLPGRARRPDPTGELIPVSDAGPHARMRDRHAKPSPHGNVKVLMVDVFLDASEHDA